MRIKVTTTVEVFDTQDDLKVSITEVHTTFEGDNPSFIPESAKKAIVRAGVLVSKGLEGRFVSHE